MVNQLNKIHHPAVRNIIKEMKIKQGLEIQHQGDLPARTGVGSSSSFSVGLINSLYALKNKKISKNKLASTAIHIEQNVIKENELSIDNL